MYALVGMVYNLVRFGSVFSLEQQQSKKKYSQCGKVESVSVIHCI